MSIYTYGSGHCAYLPSGKVRLNLWQVTQSIFGKNVSGM